MFTRCKDICPVITHHLVEVQQMLDGRVGRDIFFYSISLSPEEDSPRDLKAFAKKARNRSGLDVSDRQAGGHSESAEVAWLLLQES
jgi:protein SCO1/2